MQVFLVIAASILLPALMWGIAQLFYHAPPRANLSAPMFFAKPKSGLHSATKPDPVTDRST